MAKKVSWKTAPVETGAVSVDVRGIMERLRARGDARWREQMSKKFGITGGSAETAFGMSVGELRRLAKELRGKGKTEADRQRNHALALELWETGQYECRLLACFVDEPSMVTGAQMDRWLKDFDNWAVCDTACFSLFDRVGNGVSYSKVRQWAGRKGEFQKRGAFALLASLAQHDEGAEDAQFAEFFPIIERGATDERNFVKKAVSWALRGVGARPGLRKQAIACAKRLVKSDNSVAKWIGRDALRDLAKRS